MNVEGEGDYRAEEYYEGDGGLGYVYMPDVDDASAGRGRLILRRRSRKRGRRGVGDRAGTGVGGEGATGEVSAAGEAVAGGGGEVWQQGGRRG